MIGLKKQTDWNENMASFIIHDVLKSYTAKWSTPGTVLHSYVDQAQQAEVADIVR